MHNVLLFAGIAAIGNGIFVYGQRSAPVANNPFLFMAGAVSICALLFIALISGLWRQRQHRLYAHKSETGCNQRGGDFSLPSSVFI